jgi:hypothetical protein
MRTIRKATRATGGGIVVALFAACSDPATAPTSVAQAAPKPGFAVGDVVGTEVSDTAVAGRLTICVEGNAPGTFTVTHRPVGGGTGTSAGEGFVVLPGRGDECRIAAVGNSPSGSGIEVTVIDKSVGSLGDAATRQQNVVDEGGAEAFYEFSPRPPTEGVVSISDDVYVNTINVVHGTRLTFVIVVGLGPTGCTRTVEWFRYHGGATIVVTRGGRRANEQRAIFAATPEQPGGVTWDGGNDVLTLYQQLLAALNTTLDLGPAIERLAPAMSDARAITGGSGTHIALVGNPSAARIAALTDVLRDFNEGRFPGWPQCED